MNKRELELHRSTSNQHNQLPLLEAVNTSAVKKEKAADDVSTGKKGTESSQQEKTSLSATTRVNNTALEDEIFEGLAPITLVDVYQPKEEMQEEEQPSKSPVQE